MVQLARQFAGRDAHNIGDTPPVYHPKRNHAAQAKFFISNFWRGCVPSLITPRYIVRWLADLCLELAFLAADSVGYSLPVRFVSLCLELCRYGVRDCAVGAVEMAHRTHFIAIHHWQFGWLGRRVQSFGAALD